MATFPDVYLLLLGLQILKALEPCTWQVLPYSEVVLSSKSTHKLTLLLFVELL